MFSIRVRVRSGLQPVALELLRVKRERGLLGWLNSSICWPCIGGGDVADGGIGGSGSGTISRLVANHDIIGPVISLAPLSVLGQPVQTSTDTLPMSCLATC